MNRPLALLTAFAFLSGCQTFAPSEPDGTPPVQEADQITQPEPSEYGSFSQETLFALLTAELAGQRNRFDIALGNYVQQAQVTGDASLAERAVRIAEYHGAEQPALESARIWARNAPDNIDAHRAAAVQLARAGRYAESMTYVEQVLPRQGATHFAF